MINLNVDGCWVLVIFRPYYPLEVMSGVYCELGIYLWQYPLLVNI